MNPEAVRWRTGFGRPTKGVASYRMPRRGACSLGTEGSRIGLPALLKGDQRWSGTGGSETSQYPEEKKSNEML